MRPLDPGLVETVQRDGVVLLPDILSEEEVATLAAGVERNLANLGPLAMNAGSCRAPL